MTTESWTKHTTEGPRGGNAWNAQLELLAGRPVRTIFDCGANVGRITAFYRRVFPDAVVYAFEPNGETFAKLSEAVGSDDRVRPVHSALGDREGIAELHLAEHAWADSLVRRPDAGDPEGRSGSVMGVNVTTIDRVCEREGLDRVEVLKLDVEGVELECIRGASDLLSRGGVDLIVCELNFKPRHKGQTRASQLIEALWAHDYRLFDLYDIKRPDIDLGIGWCDGVFLRTDIHPVFGALE